jgi:hypothetical protein
MSENENIRKSTSKWRSEMKNKNQNILFNFEEN